MILGSRRSIGTPCTPAAPHSQTPRCWPYLTGTAASMAAGWPFFSSTRIFSSPATFCSQPAASTGFALAAPQRSAVSAGRSTAVALRSMGITSFCKVKLFLLSGRRRGRRPRRPRRLNGGGNKRSGQDRSLQAARSRHFVGRGLDPSGRVRREQSGVLPRRGGFHIRPGRSRQHEPPREG